MTDDHAKLWLQGNLNQMAITRARQAIGSLGRALPCRVTAVTGKIVTVEFELDASPWTLPPITITKAESPYLTHPTQVKDVGVTMPADAYLGGVSGLGGGIADLRQRGNLTALVFVPVGQSSFDPIDPDAAQLQGPNGAIIRTMSGTESSIVTDQNGTTITFGTTSFILNSTGITLTVNGQTFTWGGTQAVSTLPIKAPDVVLPNGSVNGHNHGNVENGGGVTDPMQN